MPCFFLARRDPFVFEVDGAFWMLLGGNTDNQGRAPKFPGASSQVPHSNKPSDLERRTSLEARAAMEQQAQDKNGQSFAEGQGTAIVALYRALNAELTSWDYR